VALVEALLDRVELAVSLERLDRGHLVAVAHDGEHRARLHGLAVDAHGARTAVGGVAAPVGTGEAERLAQEMDEQQARLDVALDVFTVDRKRNVDDQTS
jgi:hypothetical protein